MRRIDTGAYEFMLWCFFTFCGLCQLRFVYCFVLAVILFFNLVITPLMLKKQVTEVDYGTFMTMIMNRQVVL